MKVYFYLFTCLILTKLFRNSYAGSDLSVDIIIGEKSEIEIAKYLDGFEVDSEFVLLFEFESSTPSGLINGIVPYFEKQLYKLKPLLPGTVDISDIVIDVKQRGTKVIISLHYDSILKRYLAKKYIRWNFIPSDMEGDFHFELLLPENSKDLLKGNFKSPYINIIAYFLDNVHISMDDKIQELLQKHEKAVVEKIKSAELETIYNELKSKAGLLQGWNIKDHGRVKFQERLSLYKFFTDFGVHKYCQMLQGDVKSIFDIYNVQNFKVIGKINNVFGALTIESEDLSYLISECIRSRVRDEL